MDCNIFIPSIWSKLCAHYVLNNWIKLWFGSVPLNKCWDVSWLWFSWLLLTRKTPSRCQQHHNKRSRCLAMSAILRFPQRCLKNQTITALTTERILLSRLSPERRSLLPIESQRRPRRWCLLVRPALSRCSLRCCCTPGGNLDWWWHHFDPVVCRHSHRPLWRGDRKIQTHLTS